MQEPSLETTNPDEFALESQNVGEGRLLAFDPGTKTWGVAVSDITRTVITRLPALRSGNWKKLLLNIKDLVAEFDAAAIVIGLPLESDGTDGEMTAYVRSSAKKLRRSLHLPIILQDERSSTFEARRRMWLEGRPAGLPKNAVDSEAAAVILGDLLDRLNNADHFGK